MEITVQRPRSLTDRDAEDIPLLPNKLHPPPYKPDRFRLCNLLLFILLSGSSELSFYGFSLVATQLQQLYHISPALNYWYSSAFLAATLLLSCPASLLISSCSVKIGLAVGLALCLIGSWLRVAIHSSFYFAFVGQYLIGGSYAFFRNTITQISAHWFTPANRALSTTLFCTANNIITTISLYTPTFAINVNTVPSGQEPRYRERVSSFLLINAILVSVMGLLALAFYRERPVAPVSLSSEQIRVKPKDSFRAFFCKPSNVLIVLSSSVFCSNTICYAIVMQSGLQMFGATTSSLTPYVLLALPASLLVPLPVSVLAGRLAKFKIFIVGFNLLALLALLINVSLLHFGHSSFLGPTYLFLSVSSTAAQSLSYEALSQISYPVSEAFTAGVSLFFLKLLSLITVQLSSLLLNNSRSLQMLWLLVSLQVLSTFLSFLFREHLARRKAESLGAPPSSMSLRVQ